jgi:hypothetical protein
MRRIGRRHYWNTRGSSTWASDDRRTAVPRRAQQHPRRDIGPLHQPANRAGGLPRSGAHVPGGLDFQLLRSLGAANYMGGAVGEILAAVGNIKDGEWLLPCSVRVRLYPEDLIELRQGAGVIEKSKP